MSDGHNPGQTAQAIKHAEYGPRNGLGSALAKPSDCLAAAARGYFLAEYGLTPSQLRIMELLTRGMTTNQIVKATGLRPRTIEDYISHLNQALETGSREEIVALWLKVIYQTIDGLSLHLPELADGR